MENDIKLSPMEAYLAMFSYLDAVYQRTNSDDLGGFLGDMSLNRGDGEPMDPAVWPDWIKAIEEVRSSGEGTRNQVIYDDEKPHRVEISFIDLNDDHTKDLIIRSFFVYDVFDEYQGDIYLVTYPP